MSDHLYNLFNFDHMARTRRGTWRCGLDYDNVDNGKTVITTDGFVIELPRRVVASSIVMAHDDDFELFSMPVPFTASQVRKSIGRLNKGEYNTVEDMRFFDFLGCDKIVTEYHIHYLDADSWVVVLSQLACLEQKLLRLSIHGSTVKDSSLKPLFTRNKDGSYIVHKDAYNVVLEAVRQMDVDFAIEAGHRSIVHGETYIIGEPYRIVCDHDYGAYFWKREDRWYFVYTDSHNELRIHGEPSTLRPVRYGYHDKSELEPYVDMSARKLKEERIPINLQWLTVGIEILFTYGRWQVRPDFFGTVIIDSGSLQSAIDRYPNAKSYCVSLGSLTMTDKVLNLIGRGIVRREGVSLIVERMW